MQDGFRFSSLCSFLFFGSLRDSFARFRDLFNLRLTEGRLLQHSCQNLLQDAKRCKFNVVLVLFWVCGTFYS